MSTGPMDHAAAHERIEDLLLEPVLLEQLPTSTVPEDMALRDHVAGCAACRADLAAWRQVQRHVAEALPAIPAGAASLAVPIAAPADLRERVLAALRADTAAAAGAASAAGAVPAPATARTDRRGWTRARLGWLAAAAALVVMIGASAVAVDQAAKRGAAQAEAAALDDVVASLDRILAVPEHKVVALQPATGPGAGSLSWTRHDLRRALTALPQPTGGARYRCWLAEDGRELAVGDMDFAGDASYWIGTLNEWATLQVGPNTKFIVSLEPSGASKSKREGPTVLEADLEQLADRDPLLQVDERHRDDGRAWGPPLPFSTAQARARAREIHRDPAEPDVRLEARRATDRRRHTPDLGRAGRAALGGERRPFHVVECRERVAVDLDAVDLAVDALVADAFSAGIEMLASSGRPKPPAARGPSRRRCSRRSCRRPS